MNKYNKYQKLFFTVSCLSFLALAVQFYYIRFSPLSKNNSKIFEEEIKVVEDLLNIEKLAHKHSNMNNDVIKLSIKMPTTKKKKEPVKKEKVTYTYRWRDSGFRILSKDRMKFKYYLNGKAIFSIKNKDKKLGVGDVVVVGYNTQKKYIVETGEDTGEARNSRSVSGTVRYIGQRAAYIQIDKKRAIKYWPGGGIKMTSTSLIPAQGGRSGGRSRSSGDKSRRRN